MAISSLLMLLSFATAVVGHGRITDPPSRSTAHRYGFNTPFNDMDHQLTCGGITNQWGVNNGRCGVCGDPYQGPRENEAGGKYASRVQISLRRSVLSGTMLFAFKAYCN